MGLQRAILLHGLALWTIFAIVDSEEGREDERVKQHNIIIERWPGNPGPDGRRGTPGFRWTVTYEKGGRFQVQGFENTHAEARAAAEACLLERGIELDWLPKTGSSVNLLKPPSTRSRNRNR